VIKNYLHNLFDITVKDIRILG